MKSNEFNEFIADEKVKLKQLHDSQQSIRSQFAKFPRAQQRFYKKTCSKGAEILPNVWTDSRRTHLYLAALNEKLNALDTPAIDEHGLVSGNGLVSNFNKLRNLTGYGMQPLTIPLSSNDRLRDDYGLARDFISDRHRQIFRELVALMFGDIRPAPVVIRKAASSTFPEFSTDMQVKKTYLFSSLANIATIANLSRTGQFKKLYERFNVIFAYYLLTRAQPDTVVVAEDGTWQAKPREVASLDFALSGGTDGRRFVADKSCFDRAGALIDGFFAMRRRTVWGLSGSINYALAAVFAQFREHYLNEFSFTWKHRGPEDIANKISKYSEFFAADVKQHDQFVASWLVDYWFELLLDYLREDFVYVAKLCYRAPYYQPAVYDDETFGIWSGDPLSSASFGNNYGLPSGIAYNPDIGKLGMTFVYLVMLDDCYHDVLETGIGRILQGKANYAILDASDDVIIMSQDSKFNDWTKHKLKTGSLSPYMVVEQEQGASFLGNILVKKDSNVAVVPNIVSAVVNFLAPERGINNAVRGNWAVGWFERQNYYAAAPLFTDVYNIVNDLSKRHLGMTIGDMARHCQLNNSVAVTSLYNQADRMFLLNPDSIFYKVSFNDLSPYIRNTELSVIDYDAIEKFVKPLFLI